MTNNAAAVELAEDVPAPAPTPWELIEATEHHGAYIVNSWGRTICDLYAMSNPMAASVRNGGTSFPVHFNDMAANAALIVKAVNSHDALAAALEDLTGAMQFILAFYEPGQRYLDTNAWKQAEASARAAFAKAKIALASVASRDVHAASFNAEDRG